MDVKSTTHCASLLSLIGDKHCHLLLSQQDQTHSPHGAIIHIGIEATHCHCHTQHPQCKSHGRHSTHWSICHPLLLHFLPLSLGQQSCFSGGIGSAFRIVQELVIYRQEAMQTLHQGVRTMPKATNLQLLIVELYSLFLTSPIVSVWSCSPNRYVTCAFLSLDVIHFYLG